MKRASLTPLGSPAPHSLFDASTVLFLVFHIECHVFPPHFVLSFDTFNFLLHFLCEFALCLLSINEFQKVLQISVHSSSQPFCVQKDLRCAVSKFELRQLYTPMTKRIDSLVPAKEIKGADKDDICLTQIIVIDSFIEEIHIDHALIVTCPSRQFSIPPLCRLHLNIIDGSRVIFNVDVETHGLAVKAQIDTFLRVRIVDIANPYIQNALQQPFTEPLVLHDALKDKVVPNGEIVPCLQCLTFPFLFHVPLLSFCIFCSHYR